MNRWSRSIEELTRNIETPAFVVDERQILHQLTVAAKLRSDCGFKLLYALKPLTFKFVLQLMTGWVDGFATSSLFESRLAREVIGEKGSVHLTTPGLRLTELPELSQLCDSVAFNSWSQYRQLAVKLQRQSQVGLRINPQLSLVDDRRYDPCRRYSKLGVPVDWLVKRWKRHPDLFDALSGLQFHTNCDSNDFEPLHRTVRYLEGKIGGLFARVTWINLGGGYLLNHGIHVDLLVQAVRNLKTCYGLEVYIEPGAALVRSAGYLITTVIDVFKSNGKSVAVLDTTINHVPEVFEYQFEPEVLGHQEKADHQYRLAGSSCLAGDLLGDYAFRRPLQVGSRVVLTDVGAYAIVKAHMFNGINLPTIYSVTQDAKLIVRRRFTYEDFLSRCGACRDAAV